MFYYTFTTFDCNFIPRNAEICKVSSETKNVGKAHKYRLNRHLPTYEKIIKNLYSFFYIKDGLQLLEYDYLGGNGSRGYGRVKISNIQLEVVVGDVDDTIMEKCQKIMEC